MIINKIFEYIANKLIRHKIRFDPNGLGSKIIYTRFNSWNLVDKCKEDPLSKEVLTRTPLIGKRIQYQDWENYTIISGVIVGIFVNEREKVSLIVSSPGVNKINIVDIIDVSYQLETIYRLKDVLDTIGGKKALIKDFCANYCIMDCKIDCPLYNKKINE